MPGVRLIHRMYGAFTLEHGIDMAFSLSKSMTSMLLPGVKEMDGPDVSSSQKRGLLQKHTWADCNYVLLT